jgi:XTP/dITP diphosphohydrolase
MANVPRGKRGARFECVVAVAEPPGANPEVRDRLSHGLVFRGILHGEIAFEPRGENGFGYDPVFVVARDSKGRTLAELTAEEKNRISHRARALADLRDGFAEIAT